MFTVNEQYERTPSSFTPEERGRRPALLRDDTQSPLDTRSRSISSGRAYTVHVAFKRRKLALSKYTARFVADILTPKTNCFQHSLAGYWVCPRAPAQAYIIIQTSKTQVKSIIRTDIRDSNEKNRLYELGP